MSVTCEDFFGSGGQLASGATEIEWRNSATRTYYGAFHSAKELVIHCPGNGHLHMGDHERLSNRYQLEGSPCARAISYMLVAMKRVRHCADYDINAPFPRDLATKQAAQVPNLQARLTQFAVANGGQQVAARNSIP